MNMKTLTAILVLLMAGSLSMEAQKQIDTEKSSVVWTGKKIGGAHTGGWRRGIDRDRRRGGRMIPGQGRWGGGIDGVDGWSLVGRAGQANSR